LDCFASHLREWLKNKESDDSVDIDILLADYRKRLQQIIPNNDILLANYVIKLSYSSLTTSKTLAWQLFSDVIIRNLKDNSPEYKKSQIIEVPYKSSSSREYLGKNYQLIEGGKNV
jgi:S-adenosylmethionine synthetase